MALGSQKTSRGLAALALLMLLTLALPVAAQHQFAVRHQRSLWRDKPGELQVHDGGLRFTAAARKGGPKALELDWNDIQQLALTPSDITVVTYQDRLWQFGRDRHFRFILAAEPGQSGDFAVLESLFTAALGQRLIRGLPGETGTAQWSLAAKRTGVPRGAEGVLSFDGQELRFHSEKPGHSRRWPLATVQTIASTGPLAFTVVAPERALADQGGFRSFEFQLKQPLTPDRYRQLWLAIEAAHGTQLRFQQSN